MEQDIENLLKFLSKCAIAMKKKVYESATLLQCKFLVCKAAEECSFNGLCNVCSYHNVIIVTPERKILLDQR